MSEFIWTSSMEVSVEEREGSPTVWQWAYEISFEEMTSSLMSLVTFYCMVFKMQ